jgi:hypothetical protein
MLKDRKRWELLLSILVVFSAEPGLALSLDPQLLSMVPPRAGIVAGVRPIYRSGSEQALLFINPENEIDLYDFLAVFGVDEGARLDHVMVVGEVGNAGNVEQHSVLASGRFNSDLIFKSVIRNGATTDRYKGIAVLVLKPFARDPADLITTRWLTILNARLAIFGSITIVQEELDRHLAGITADSTLTERLSHLREADDCWSAIRHFVSGERVKQALGLLDPKLASSVLSGDEFVFGIHFGRQVEIEYESFAPLQSSQSTGSASPASRGPETYLLQPNAGREQKNGSAHVVMTTSREKYDSWRSTIVADAKRRRAHINP